MECCTELASSEPRLAAAVTAAADQDAGAGGWTLRNAMDAVLQSVASGSGSGTQLQPAGTTNVSSATAVEVSYVSDMQRYKLTISGGGEGARRGLTWAHSLPIEAGHHSLKLPLSEFKASARGRPLYGAVLNPAEICVFGVTCSIFDNDGKAVPGAEGGDFAFLLEGIKLVSA